MLQNAFFLAKIGADAAENEQHFAEILPIGRRVAVVLPLRFCKRRSPEAQPCTSKEVRSVADYLSMELMKPATHQESRNPKFRF